MSDRINRAYVSRHLHRWVYVAMAGLGLWYIVSVWLGFAGIGYTDYLLTIASLFIIGVVALLIAAARIGSHTRRTTARRGGDESFAAWASGELDTATGRVSGGTAFVEILLPIAAIAFGMTAFAIIAIASG